MRQFIGTFLSFRFCYFSTWKMTGWKGATFKNLYGC